MNIPLVSVLVPVYNTGEYICRCAESLFNQSYPNLEFIFVDDCSPDDAISRLNHLIETNYSNISKKIRVIRHTQNKGLSGARSTALDAANGEYVMHVDSDDWLPTNAIALMMDKALASNSDMVVGNMAYTYGPDSETLKEFAVDENAYVYSLKIFTREPGFSPGLCNRLIRRSVHLKAKPAVGINFGEDYAVTPRLAYFCNKIAKVDAVTYYYWQGNQTSYCRNISMRSFDDLIRATDLLCDFFRNEPKNVIRLAQLRIKIALLSTGNTEINREASKLYPDIKSAAGESMISRIVFTLGQMHLHRTLSLFVHTGSKLKSILRKIKRN